MINIFKKLFLFICMFTFYTLIFSQEIKQYNLMPPVTRLVILEETFSYSVRSYQPVVRQVIPIFSVDDKQNLLSAETALIRYFSILKSTNFEKISSQWVQSSQAFVRKTMDRPLPELSAAWTKLYKNSEIEFLNKIEYGKYTLIEVKILDTNGTLKDQDIFAFEVEDGRMKLTYDLADDPVMCCWKNSNNRIRRVGVPGRGFPDILKNYR